MGEKSTTKAVRYWDTVAEAWQEAHPQELWRVYSDAVNVALFSRWMPEDGVKRVLKTDLFDEAVGEGLYPLLASRAQCVFSIDVSSLLVQAACSRHHGLRATRADVRRLPFADGAFDVIVSNSTLDHFAALDDLVIGLRDLHRVLRPGGELLLTLDNLANPIIALRNALPIRLVQRLGLVPYYVGVTCGPHHLRRLLAQAGFEVREVRAMLHCPRVFAVALARVLKRRAQMKTQRLYVRFLMAWECLSRWPGRFLTGYYIAVRATKRAEGDR